MPDPSDFGTASVPAPHISTSPRGLAKISERDQRAGPPCLSELGRRQLCRAHGL